VYFLVLNAPEAFYPKLRDQYLDFVRSLAAFGPGNGAGGAPGRGSSMSSGAGGLDGGNRPR